MLAGQFLDLEAENPQLKLTLKKICEIQGKGINGYKYKKNLTINLHNSGTLGRLLLGILINTPYPIKLIGDKSLSKRDFKRVASPLSKFGAKFILSNGKGLPLRIFGSSELRGVSSICGGNISNELPNIRCKSVLRVLLPEARISLIKFLKKKVLH